MTPPCTLVRTRTRRQLSRCRRHARWTWWCGALRASPAGWSASTCPRTTRPPCAGRWPAATRRVSLTHRSCAQLRQVTSSHATRTHCVSAGEAGGAEGERTSLSSEFAFGEAHASLITLPRSPSGATHRGRARRRRCARPRLQPGGQRAARRAAEQLEGGAGDGVRWPASDASSLARGWVARLLTPAAQWPVRPVRRPGGGLRRALRDALRGHHGRGARASGGANVGDAGAAHVRRPPCCGWRSHAVLDVCRSHAPPLPRHTTLRPRRRSAAPQSTSTTPPRGRERQ